MGKKENKKDDGRATKKMKRRKHYISHIDQEILNFFETSHLVISGRVHKLQKVRIPYEKQLRGGRERRGY